MKKIKFFLLGMLFPILAGAQADAINSYFQHYVEDTSFTSIYISPKMFSLVSNLNVDDMDPEVRDMIKSLKGLRVLTSDRNAEALYKEALAKFSLTEYESLMTVKSDNENVNFLIKSDGNTISELLLLVGGDEFVMLSLIGDIDLDKVAKLAENMDIKGSEHLEKIKSNEKN